VEKLSGASTLVFVRQHPTSKSGDTLISATETASTRRIQDVNELLLSADIVISDYSSVLFDATLIPNMPSMVAFTPDYKDYSRRPGLYFDYEDTPILQTSNVGKIATLALSGLRQRRYAERDYLHAKIGVQEDGNAATRAVSFLLEHVDLEG
jgi:CDP-glycerol glycerophosphotransferase